MTTLSVQVPESVYRQIETLAAREQMPLEQLVALALTAQVTVWLSQDDLAARARRGSWAKFKQVLDKVPDIEPEPYDR